MCLKITQCINLLEKLVKTKNMNILYLICITAIMIIGCQINSEEIDEESEGLSMFTETQNGNNTNCDESGCVVMYWLEDIADGKYTLAYKKRFESTECEITEENICKNKIVDIPGYIRKCVKMKSQFYIPYKVEVYFDRKNITLTLNPANGQEKTVLIGKMGASVNAVIPTKAGWKFAGWNPELPKTFPTSDVEYKAEWIKEGDYKITYELNGGVNAPENPTGYTSEIQPVIFAAPTKNNYKFVGWYSDNAFKNKIEQIEKDSTGDITLYAKWMIANDNAIFDIIATLHDTENTLTLTEEITDNTIKQISEALKRNCTVKVNLELSKAKGIRKIPDYSFIDCCNLVSIVLPSCIKEIGYCAFYGCTSLESVTFPKKLCEIGNSAFWNCKMLSTVNYLGTIEEWQNFQDKLVHSYMMESWNAILCEGNGSLFSGKIKCNNGILSNIFISNNPIAFIDNESIRNIIATEIAASSHSNGKVDNIGSIYVPCITVTRATSKETIAVIFEEFKKGNRRFDIDLSEAICLTEILPNEFKDYQIIRNIVLPSTIKKIGSNAFKGCTFLESVKIPNTVESIGDYAFDGCTKLKTINYDGLERNWEKIIGKNNKNIQANNGSIKINYEGSPVGKKINVVKKSFY